MSKNNENNKSIGYVCCQCGEPYSSLTNFYKTYSILYISTGYLPICKKCMGNLFESYIKKYGDIRKAMKRLCMAFDFYYNDSLFDTCNNGTDATLGNYIKRLNMRQYSGKTFDTSIREGFKFEDDDYVFRVETSNKKQKNDPEDINPNDIKKWGDGFTSPDYDVLNEHYKLLKNANPNCDSNQEIFINDLCYIKMQQMKAAREGKTDDFSKMTESYRKSFAQAGLKTVKDINAMEDFTIGVNAETIEKYTPAEYYKNKSLYKDHDDIGDYITRFLLRPLRNLMFGTKDRDEEFYVKSEEDTDGYADEE